MVIARKESLLRFGREQDLKGERGKPTYWCMPIELSLFFPQFPLFSSLFSFLSIFFSFYSVFLFTPWMFYFSIPFSGHDKGPFIVPAVINVLPLYPLTAFVWSGRTCRPPSLCDIHPCQTKVGLFRSSVYRSTSFLPRYKCFLSLLSRHAPNGSPSNLPLLGGLSSQQDIPPKRAWAGAAK